MSSPRRKYPAWQRRFYGVLEWLLDHPGATLRECARYRLVRMVPVAHHEFS
jgi:hypothetical protein